MGMIVTILWRLIVRGQMLAIGYNLSFAVTNLSFTAINQGFVKGEELFSFCGLTSYSFN